jgi:hypothetical protein
VTQRATRQNPWFCIATWTDTWDDIAVQNGGTARSALEPGPSRTVIASDARQQTAERRLTGFLKGMSVITAMLAS